MLNTIKNKFLKIDKQDVISDAREKGIAINKIDDFRNLENNYSPIDTMMQQYAKSFARSSAIGGLTTGINGFTSSLTYACIDTALLSLRLYRLAQRYAILNGFDPDDPLHKNKMMKIYFEALGVNAVAQAGLKYLFSNAGDEINEIKKRMSTDSVVLKVIIKASRLYYKRISSKGRWLFIPVVGVTASYSLAKKVSGQMQKSYKQAYFDNWK